MKNKIILLTALAFLCLIGCMNPIMEKWWVEEEREYVPITKNIPIGTQQTVYETIYKQVIQYVPTYIYEIIFKTEYVTVYEDVIKEVPKYIYETVIETKYETIYETVFETVYETIHDIVEVKIYVPPTDEQIKDYIKDHSDEIITIIKDDPHFETIIKEYIRDHFDEVIKIINNSPNSEEIIRKIIESIPPDVITNYLTKEQIQYILEQQPPQVILQTITIIDIEYIIFAGNADKYNGPHGPGASTDLTAQEKSSNDASVSDMAKALKDHPDYLIMMHGHANPTSFTEGETGELKKLSEDRAKAVEEELKKKFKALNSGVDIDNTRVTVSGYGGEKILFGNNSTYTALNRRVEMILVRVGI
ncbi:MAG: OmpA family protein [Treponema sp.]|jgi:hypothetical protein|nr:OmpA family protein [Treponema sp.]